MSDGSVTNLNKQVTIPVNTTRILIAFRKSGKTYTDNRELLGGTENGRLCVVRSICASR